MLMIWVFFLGLYNGAEADGEVEVCRMLDIFGSIVEYSCPEKDRSLRYCCGPKKSGKCCEKPNPNLRAEEEEFIKNSNTEENATVILIYLALATGILLLFGGCIICCCRCCPCCYLAKREKRREAEVEQQQQHEEVPLGPSDTEMNEKSEGYPAAPWPPQNSAPQQWPYNPAANNAPAPYPQQAYQVRQTGYPQPAYPQPAYPQPGYPQPSYPQPGYPAYPK